MATKAERIELGRAVGVLVVGAGGSQERLLAFVKRFDLRGLSLDALVEQVGGSKAKLREFAVTLEGVIALDNLFKAMRAVCGAEADEWINKVTKDAEF